MVLMSSMGFKVANYGYVKQSGNRIEDMTPLVSKWRGRELHPQSRFRKPKWPASPEPVVFLPAS